MLSREITWIDPALIVVDLETRQRKQELDCGDLIPSIRERGVMLPLLVEEGSLRLVAGWRRLTSAIFCAKAEVPIRTVPPGLSELQLARIEWEENAKRKDLSWQDNALAQWTMHCLCTAEYPNWGVENTAQLLSQSEQHTYRMIDIGEHVAEADAAILAADTLANAQTILIRRRARNAGEVMNRILELDDDDSERTERDGADDGETGPDLDPAGDPSGPLAGGERADVPADRVLRPVRSVEPAYTIRNADAHEWLANYAGPKFNFLHCDLPYGVALNAQAGQASFEGSGYESSPDIYWHLCRSIRDNWSRFMYPSSHIMFWISMKFYRETIEFFEEAPEFGESLRINPTPLIWHKTDNKGIIADHLRGPRNIYEAALIMSTGDRHLVRPTSNVYGCPTAKGAEAIHTNEKPEPMLRYFFQMFVDKHSRVLDPTCGSGTSIRAAESLGAEAAMGLEFNPEFADRAAKKLVAARGLANLSKLVSSVESSPLDIDPEEA